MAQKTPNYNLNKPGYEDFGDVDMLNENFEKIDKVLAATDPAKITTKVAPADGDGVMIADSADGGKAKRLLWSNVKASLGKLFVPLARKINGKTLTKDVTLTGDDIAMGADDAESLRAAMVYFSVRAKLMLQLYIAERRGGEALFASSRAPYEPLTDRGIEKMISKLGKRIGMERPLYPHLMRHTFASHALNCGMELTIIQHLLGHSDPKTTLIYAEIDPIRVQYEYNRMIC